jgi:hypothetical protein
VQYGHRMTRRHLVVGVGMSVVMLYAALVGLDSLVFEPLAMVSGHSLGSIYARLIHEQGRADVAYDVVSAASMVGVGTVLAISVGVVSRLTRVSLRWIMTMFLAVVVCGAAATFGAGIGTNMDVADTYGLGGGDRTVFAPSLYVASMSALVAIPAVWLIRTRWARSDDATGQDLVT